ncbi:MAG: Rpn family recombination-promoting nuclease/putative transposase [Fibromonadaceae bacterium]|nr:Rpn family recombination-promoting nuclease/putative transposase [Fibromonadaceae bacterium]
MPAKRKYKDSVFISLFSDKKRLLELYNAIEGTSYKDPNLININTLEGVLFPDRQNDISFTIGDKVVVLIEHQSSVNENMPLRFLIYISKVYEKIIDSDNIYKRDLIKIPMPEFIVLYNGVEKYPKEKTLKLSAAFEQAGIKKAPELELTVRVLNINKGHNPKLEQRSKSLAGYSAFVAKVRELQSQGCSLKDSVKDAVVYCINKGILQDYLRRNSSEVVNMLYTEWKWEDARVVWEKEAEARGMARGEAKARNELFSLWEKGVPLAEAKRKLGTHSNRAVR